MKLQIGIAALAVVIASLVGGKALTKFSETYSYYFPPTQAVEPKCYYEGMEGKSFIYSVKDGTTVRAKILKVDCNGKTVIEYGSDKRLHSIDSKKSTEGFMLMDEPSPTPVPKAVVNNWGEINCPKELLGKQVKIKQEFGRVERVFCDGNLKIRIDTYSGAIHNLDIAEKDYSKLFEVVELDPKTKLKELEKLADRLEAQRKEMIKEYDKLKEIK